MDARTAEPFGGHTIQEDEMSTTLERTTSAGNGTRLGPVFVAGGTGKTGRRVAARLEALGVPVRIGSRRSQPAFDWEQSHGWASALEGSKAVYAAYAPDLAVPGAVAAIEQLIDLAKRARIERFVLLSGRGEPEAQAAEALVQHSGLDWTIVRCAWFMQNFSENYFIDGILAGELALPVGAVREPFVDADDIAEVVATALTQPGHNGQLYELTGPRTLTMAEAMQEIALATGREIRYTELDQEVYEREMRAAGLPSEVIWLLQYLFTTVLDGRNAWLGDGVQRALGRPPRDFRDYARDAASTGCWNPTS
ncbi:MAG: NAD(P)H-binding protein [Thermomicrobiales bacterium]|nr:NAD(P)H-binding protein [Thermomicrobiales bacterium]MCO5220704.1 NAD(P)H-binding protein [Thermomicrobiales bacterium]